MTPIKTLPPLWTTGRWVRALVATALIVVVPPCAVGALDPGGPLPWGSKPVSTHAPYGSRDCIWCHTKRTGGPLNDATDHMCLECHPDGKQHTHAPRSCIRCHNAHDSMRAKLLRADLSLCKECHAK